ncbi:MAG: DNA-directed RNA polymerase subunit K/omega [Saprospiraceae bacterium]|jgi:DNA-directed RNA polymerase subunit K/omega
MSIDDQVEQIANKRKAGTILFSEDFQELNNAGAVKVALHRLVKKGDLRRLARGIYARPKFSELVGEVLPSTEEIAKAIAKRDKARILPTGTYALHVLGLSTQIPLNLVYLTDGSPRKINIGNRTIQFKKTTPKNLALKGEVSKLVVQALKEIGKSKVTSEEVQKIIDVLKKEDHKTLKHDIRLAPQWIAEIMANVLEICQQ